VHDFGVQSTECKGNVCIYNKEGVLFLIEGTSLFVGICLMPSTKGKTLSWSC
jgi:hypothetical protein